MCKMKHILMILFLCLGLMGLHAKAGTITSQSDAPIVGAGDIAQLNGPISDAENIDGPGNTYTGDNDASTYVADDRMTQGQLFTTGLNPGGYTLTGIWVQHVLYTEYINNGTWSGLEDGTAITVRIVDPAQAGTGGFVLSSEVATVAAGSGIPGGGGTWEGTGFWLYIALDTPVVLSAGTQYGFDLTSYGPYFELAGLDTDQYDGGSAYTTAAKEDLNTGTVHEGDRVFVVELEFGGIASAPYPVNEATDVSRDVILNWMPGPFAVAHDVYLGTDFNDVNNADASSPLLVGPAQDANNYDPGRLDLGRTYFWRIDEVEADGTTIHKGSVWSFTVEPYAIPILGENITATASSQVAGNGPENTINGSGLVDDLHSNDSADMWLTKRNESGPAWIQYEFDNVYKLHEMTVWNYNGLLILWKYGIKDVTVEYSTDANNWTQLDNVSEFAVAPGEEGYAANTIVPFGGVAAKYVRITPISNWGLPGQYGLSEVRFTYFPVSAREPSPDNRARDIALDVTLGWRAGREAVEHNVYLSTDQQAVMDGTALVDTVSQTSYGPISLDLENAYYWRINEVNNAEATPIWQSNIWNFLTQEYLVVDDFESYNDIEEGEESNLVYVTWSDGGYGPTNDPTNGSTIGYLTVPSLDPNIVHGGEQSVPLTYDNSSASLSEVTANTNDLAIGTDWTKGGAGALVLWFYGDPNNSTTEQMYLEINGTKVVYDGDPGDIAVLRWNLWVIDLASIGVNQSSITTLAIGIERTGATGGTGTVLIDDIRLYKTPVDPGTENLVHSYTFEDGTANDSIGSAHGTLVGDANIADGSLLLDGTNDWMSMPGDVIAINTYSEVSIEAWFTSVAGGNTGFHMLAAFGEVGTGESSTAGYNYLFITPARGDDVSRVAIQTSSMDNTPNNDESGVSALVEHDDGLLHHFVCTVNASHIVFYIDGNLVGSAALAPGNEIAGISQAIAYLGKGVYSIDPEWAGAIHEFNIYNRALLSSEVLYLATH